MSLSPQTSETTETAEPERSSRSHRWTALAVAGALIAGAAVTARVVNVEATTTRTCGGRNATVVGTAKGESLVGTKGPDVIWAGEGRDRVYGLAGDDVICGGGNNDVVVGGPGNDWLDGGAGTDRTYGDDGWDLCKNSEQMQSCESVGSGPTTTTTTAPPTTVPPTTAPPTTAPPTTAPPTTRPPAPPAGNNGLPVDESKIPAPVPGISYARIESSGETGTAMGDGVGAFRVNCTLSHMSFDDPIVFPGQSRATHLHAFFGNTGVNANSTVSSIANSGNSTCSGGTANRTGYWVPAMIDTTTNAPVTSFHGLDANWQTVGAPNGDQGLQVYYKTGYRGVQSSQVVNFPAGLRMIAGDSRRTTDSGQAAYDSPATYHCHALGDFGGGSGHQQSIPNCPPGTMLIMAIMFPQCWDGRNLDSADHKSHMAYANPGQGCPASHPVPLPEITFNVRYLVPAGGTSTWRLSSDTYSGPAGYSGHADWFNGWDANVFQQVVNNCYSGGLDCHMNVLNNGTYLAGPAPR